MKIKNSKNLGFYDIHTNFDLFIEEQSKVKLSIKLALPNNKDNINYLIENFHCVHKMGSNYVVESTKVFTITGHRKIAKIIGQIITHPDYNHSENTEILNMLTAIENHLKEKIQPKLLSSTSKEFAKYEVMNEEVTREKGTAIPSHSIFKVKKENSNTINILKLYPEGRSITEIEVFNSVCYRILLNNQTPKCSSVHDINGNRVAILSRYINNFQSLQDYYRKKEAELSIFTHPPKNDLIKSGISRILAAAYCEEENDLHGGNIGYDPVNFKTYKIDHDQATWPITSKYRGILADTKQGSGRAKGITPNNAFPITQRDISNFPFLRDAKPNNFPDQVLDLDDVRNNSIFIKDAFTIFLKKALLDESIYTNIAASTIGSSKLREKLVVNKTERSNKLKSELLKNPKFYQFISKNNNIKNDILFEVKQYNDEYKFDNPLQIDLAQLEKNYDALYTVILENKDKMLQQNNLTESINESNLWDNDPPSTNEIKYKVTTNRRRF